MTRRTQPKRKRAAGKRSSVPAEMTAAVIDEFGPPSVIERREMPVPRPGPGEVLIAVSAAGVGSWDAKVRDGSWAEDNDEFPRILGVDGAGTIAEVGESVRRFHVGDLVWAYQFESPKGGFYAEYVVADADHVGSVPPSLTFGEAAAAAATGLTAFQGVAEHLDLKRGETVMIFGASGAVGTLAVQFAARDRGASVIAIASGSRAKRQLEKLGAETVIDARRPNAIARIEEAAPDGLDAILALANSPVLQKSIKFVRRGGRVAFPNGVEPEPRRRDGVRVTGYDANASPRDFAQLARAVEKTKLSVPIAARFPLSQAAKAHRRVEHGHDVGRVVLDIR